MDTLRTSRAVLLATLAAAIAFAEGCRAIEGIFKAGVWVGVILAVVIVGAIFAFVRSIQS
jgi:hypothetical protein